MFRIQTCDKGKHLLVEESSRSLPTWLIQRLNYFHVSCPATFAFREEHISHFCLFPVQYAFHTVHSSSKQEIFSGYFFVRIKQESWLRCPGLDFVDRYGMCSVRISLIQSYMPRRSCRFIQIAPFFPAVSHTVSNCERKKKRIPDISQFRKGGRPALEI